jgi:hypothetical protein
VYAYAQEIYRNIAKSNIELFSKCLVLKIIVSVLFDVADNMTGFGKLFADDTCIGHMAHNEENLHTLMRTDLEYSNTWSYR